MRLAVLSEDADRWSETVSRWMAANMAYKTSAAGTTIPDAIDEYALYQTLVSAWPLGSVDNKSTHELHKRMSQWWTKALREAKRHSSWIAPNAAYEEGCMKFVESILGDASFVAELSNFVKSIAAAAALAGLTQTFLRLTTPGVPDLYQGCDFWDFSLVDPDNRRAIDYATRKTALHSSRSLREHMTKWRSGTVKQRLIATILAHRRQMPQLYGAGDYVPIAVSGTHAAHVIAFERRFEGTRIVCVASRWAQSFLGADGDIPLIAAERWKDTTLSVDAGAFTDALSGEVVSIENGCRLSDVLGHFPIALLSAQTAVS
jgi:(1->4)-alpha-D-glucan 1-alpha-D-glucosylmutase